MPSNIIAGDASNEFSLLAGNDGALAVQVGAAGAKVTAQSIAANGVTTFLGMPVLPTSGTLVVPSTPSVTTPQSMVRLNTANGYGSTNTKILRFTNVTTNQGSDITYTDSATLGASFTINTNGVYSVSFSWASSAATAWSGISLNTTGPTLSITGIPLTEVLAYSYSAGLNYIVTSSATVYLVAGSIIRAHADAQTSSSSPAPIFTIPRVS